MTQRIITEDDIPSECKIDIYPDDSPLFQPIESNDSDIPYSVVYEGECKKFNDIFQGCRNKSLKYPICPFLSNAVEVFCGYDGLYDISPTASKLFIIAKDQ